MIDKSIDSLPRDLPAAIWAVLPLVMIVILGVLMFTAPEAFEQAFVKDTEGVGLVEHGTVIVLLPGVVAGFVAFFVYRKRLFHRWLWWWVLMWMLACVYFAGEETSWGQHFFGWTTPDAIMALNDQLETNIHNISSWFDQKPRAIVELWIIIGGIFVPVRNLLKRKVTSHRNWAFWFWPTHVCIIAAVLMMLVRLLEWTESWIIWQHLGSFGSSELREYYVALFLSFYLLSFWFRLRQEANVNG